MKIPNRDRKFSFYGLLLIAASLPACGNDPKWNESLDVKQSAAAPEHHMKIFRYAYIAESVELEEISDQKVGGANGNRTRV